MTLKNHTMRFYASPFATNANCWLVFQQQQAPRAATQLSECIGIVLTRIKRPDIPKRRFKHCLESPLTTTQSAGEKQPTTNKKFAFHVPLAAARSPRPAINFSAILIKIAGLANPQKYPTSLTINQVPRPTGLQASC